MASPLDRVTPAGRSRRTDDHVAGTGRPAKPRRGTRVLGATDGRQTNFGGDCRTFGLEPDENLPPLCLPPALVLPLVTWPVVEAAYNSHNWNGYGGAL